MALDIATQAPPEHAPFGVLAELGFAAAFTFGHLVALTAGDRPVTTSSPSSRPAPVDRHGRTR